VPISKKRKKKGKPVKPPERLVTEDSGVTLQDLINMVAYQDYVADGTIEGPQIPDDADIPEETPDLPGENWDEDDSNDQEEDQDGGE
jgi:hypothetical protein